VDPEIVFHNQFFKNKVAWSRKLTSERGKKIVIYGGSSCAFSVQGLRMLDQHGLPVVNMGLGAQDGAALLTQAALSEVLPGDTLIVALEPGLLCIEHKFLPSGCKLSLALGHPEWMYVPGQAPWAPTGAYLGAALRANIGLKWMLLLPDSIYPKSKKPHWRYHLADTDASGYQTLFGFDQSLPFEAWAILPSSYGPLSADGKVLLQWVRDWCALRKVRVAYSLPWAHRESGDAEPLQRANLTFIKELSAIIPVLKDPRMGIYLGRSHFLDSEYHPDPETAALHTDELAGEIQHWETWGAGELESWEQAHFGTRAGN